VPGGADGLRVAWKPYRPNGFGRCRLRRRHPGVFFSSRNLQVPFSNPKKIRMVLPFEIEPHLPFQAEDLAIDFSILALAPLRSRPKCW